MINFIMQRDETPLAVSGVDTGRLATVCIPGGTGTNCTFDKIYKEEFLEMKNLKKVLALVLAMASVFGLSATAGAAATDFNDYDEIGNKEAVEVMSSLNVIGGNDKGDFNPDSYLTRAEMCKMVAYVMNGGEAPVLGSSVSTSYTDTAYSWAKDYIEYVTSMGIVGGVGGGKFSPDGTLTGVQAAKMMLTAMGYDANVFGFGGTGWDVNVNRYANQTGLYNGLSDMQPNLPITRDQAAQLMYNAIQATMVRKTWSQDMSTGEISETYSEWYDSIVDKDGGGYTVPHTLLADKFDGAIRYGYMSGYDYDAVKDQWTYDFTTGAAFGGKSIAADKAMDTSSLISKEDYTSFFGQRLKVIYNTKDEDVIYGIYTSDSSVVATGATGEIGTIDSSAKTVEINGSKYKVDNTGIDVFVERTGAYGINSDTSLTAMKDSDNSFTFELVDNNGDGKGDAVLYHPLTVAQITYVGKDTITLNEKVDDSAVLNTEDISIYDGYAKGDWVFITEDQYATKDIHTFEKAELKNATVTGYRDGKDGKDDEYQLDGKWYTVAGDKADVDSINIGDTVNYVACGAKLYFAEITDLGATTKNLAMVVTAAENKTTTGVNDGSVSIEAKLLLADGTTKVVNISKVDGKDVDADNYTTLLTPLVGKLVTYRASGDYELTTVNDDNTAGYKSYKGGQDGYEDGAIANIDLASDAIVFVFDDKDIGAVQADSGNSGKVFTGREIINQFGKDAWGEAGMTQVLTSNVSGYTYVKVAAIINDFGDKMPEITAGSNYGYLTENAYQSYEDGKYYLNFTLYTSNGTVTAKFETTDDPSMYVAGNIITYDVASDGIIKNVSEIDSTDGLTMGVVSGTGASKVQIATDLAKVTATNSSYTLNDDTAIIYVDSKNTEGAEGGSIQIGQLYDKDSKAYAYNVRYMLNDSNDTVVLIVVDINNDYGTAQKDANRGIE